MTQIQAILTTAFFQCLSKTLGTPILPKWFKQSSFHCEPFCFLKSAKSLCTSWYLPAHSCIQLSTYIYIYIYVHRCIQKLLLFLLKHGKKSLQSSISEVAALCITNCFSWGFEKTYRAFLQTAQDGNIIVHRAEIQIGQHQRRKWLKGETRTESEKNICGYLFYLLFSITCNNTSCKLFTLKKKCFSNWWHYLMSLWIL